MSKKDAANMEAIKKYKMKISEIKQADVIARNTQN
jgi:hypothetical protein